MINDDWQRTINLLLSRNVSCFHGLILKFALCVHFVSLGNRETWYSFENFFFIVF